MPHPFFFLEGWLQLQQTFKNRSQKNVETAKCQVLSWGFVSWETNLSALNRRMRKLERSWKLADEICYLDSICKEILGGGNSNMFYFDPYLGKITILTNVFSKGLKPPTRIRKSFLEPFKSRASFWWVFKECCFFCCFGCFLGLHNVEVYVGCVYLVNKNLFSFYTMLTLYQAVRQGTNFHLTGQGIWGTKMWVVDLYASFIHHVYPVGQRPLK